jgi:activator-of-BECN1-regulated-autophagy protein 1
VKIICIATGRILQTLVGHPRTPWSVKFHPTNPRYVASGCLGFQVRFWDIETGRCLYVSTLRHAIISISFHASGDILAIASGTCVYTWDYQHSCPRIAMFSYQTLRSVTFLPDPNKILVGEANERYVVSIEYLLSSFWLD